VCVGYCITITSFNLRVQEEADKLKLMTVGGIPTKVIVVGIERQVNETELNNIASTPVDRNIIFFDPTTSIVTTSVFSDVERRLIDAIGISCVGQWSPKIHK